MPPVGGAWRPPGEGYPAPPNNATAMWSFALGIAPLVLCLGVVAIVLGFVARAEIRDGGGRERGAEKAALGIVFGVISLLWLPGCPG